MRQVHRAGEKAFVDFSGKRPVIYDATTGAVQPVGRFVGVLGARSYLRVMVATLFQGRLFHRHPPERGRGA